MLSSTWISSSIMSIWSDNTGTFGVSGGGGGVSCVIGMFSSSIVTAGPASSTAACFSLVLQEKAPKVTANAKMSPSSIKSNLLFSRLAPSVFFTSISLFFVITQFKPKDKQIYPLIQLSNH